MENARIKWLDIVRGIGIMLVVLGHTSIPGEEGIKWLSAFHMPLFFVISGYCYKRKTIATFLKKRIKSIVIPYFLFYLIYIIVELTLGIKCIDRTLWQNIIDILLGNDTMLWFLVTIFLVEFIYTILLERISEPKRVIIVVGILTIIGMLLAYHQVELWFRIHTALCMIGFYHIGSWLFQINFFEQTKSKSLLYMILFMGLNVLITFNNEHIDVRTGKYGNCFLFYIAAVSGCCAVFFLAKLIGRFGILELLGRNSIYIYAFNVKIANWLTYISEEGGFNLSVKLFSGIFLFIIVITCEYKIFHRIWNKIKS